MNNFLFRFSFRQTFQILFLFITNFTPKLHPLRKIRKYKAEMKERWSGGGGEGLNNEIRIVKRRKRKSKVKGRR